MKLKNLIGIGLSSLVVGALALSGGIIAVQAGKTGEEALKNAAESKLTVVRDLQKHSIENYLNTIRSQIKTFANNEMTVYAMNSFTMAFSSFEYDSNISASASEQAAGLSDYYNKHYKSEYSNRNHGKSIGTQQLLNELSPISQKLQFSYIHSNSNPLGEKHKLDSTGDGSRYDTIHKNLHHKMRAFLEEFGYYDIFLVEPESGTIVYSVFKELDFATSVTTGPYAGTGIGDVFRQAMDKGTPGEVFISDFAPYPPSYEDPAAFLSSAIFEEGEKIGVLVFQIPIDKLNAIMSNNRRWEEAGLGKTGESFLIGGDTKMRSVSRMLIQEPEALKAEMEKVGMNEADLDTMILKETSIGLLKVNNQTSQQVLNGQTGITTDISYHGTPVLSAYAPLDIPGLHWGIISEISEKEAVADAESLMASVLQLAGATIIGLGLLAIIAGRVFASKLSSPLVSASELAQTIAEGNLLSGDSTCRTKNEIGDLSRALSSMSDKLNQIITRIYQGSNDLDSSAREFASTSENLARRTEQQANSIRETASTLHDLSEIASSNASLANKASDLTRDMQSNASCGQEAMTSMMDSIKEIKESSSRILDVVDVVEEIAFQTNLLALNASVEAARAGEHGRGFAVVATEVRNLALRSATAVKEIDTLAKESNARVEQGNSHAERMDTIIHAIRNSAENVMGTVNEIGEASKNQADAISNLNDTIRTIDETTQKNAASVQESAVGSKRLETLAQELQENVSYFSLQGESAPQPNLIRPRSPA